MTLGYSVLEDHGFQLSVFMSSPRTTNDWQVPVNDSSNKSQEVEVALCLQDDRNGDCQVTGPVAISGVWLSHSESLSHFNQSHDTYQDELSVASFYGIGLDSYRTITCILYWDWSQSSWVIGNFDTDTFIRHNCGGVITYDPFRLVFEGLAHRK